MKTDTSYLKLQYELIRDSRQTLFDYCKKISQSDFVEENSSFGQGGSIRNLLVHIANTYKAWIVNRAMMKDVAYTAYQTIHNMEEMAELFAAIDSEMYEFIVQFEKSELEEIHYKKEGIEKFASVLKLFTHVTTHEFHHKGQILSLSRHLGYIPIDTDVLR